jgi:hypothetical protein
MRNKQIRVEHAAVQVDARSRGDAAAGALLGVKRREPQVEIVVVRTDLIVGNPQLAETSPAEQLEPIVPDQCELLGMIRHLGRDWLSRLKIRAVALGRLDLARQLLPCDDDPAEDLFPSAHAIGIARAGRDGKVGLPVPGRE